MSARKIPHEVISASAGSGKTFQLSHRYIRLLALGIAPDRICALTFSRKAAGEIFESVVERLCFAAASDANAEETARIAEISSMTASRATAMLRAVLSSLNRLHVGTLDSFMVGVVRAFPVELGVPVDFRVTSAEGTEAAELRRQILTTVFDARRTDEATRRELFEAFKQATFGREEKALGEQIDGFIESMREQYYRVLPNAAHWGVRTAIWGDETPWRPPTGPDGLHAAVERARDLFLAQGWSETVLDRWMAFADAVQTFRPGAPWLAPLTYLAEKLIPLRSALEQGYGELKLNRTACVLEGDLCRAVHAMVQHIVGSELQGAAETTRGLFRILALFEQLYDARARRLGLLSFSDAQYLLTANSPSGVGLMITRDIEAADRLYIDYRLDCQLDHWLLDEFQDTSDLQWAVLHNLLDEILQDDSGRRSLFYVGDVKQSIYRWRGGNPRLFGAIRDHYRRQIRERHLVVSYRSCPPVIETVNRVFDHLPGALPVDAVARWADIWRTHEAAPMLHGKAGYACLMEPDHDGGTVKPDADDRYRLVAALLRRMRPLERGLSVAVLVRTNASGKAAVDVLRRECPGLTVVHEGNASILDTPVVTLLLSLLRFAAHPADTFAWRHVQMSPLHPVLVREIGDADRICLDLLRTVQQHGFHQALTRYGALLEQAVALDAFGRLRLGDLLAAAAEVDATGSRDIDQFLRSAEAYQVRELAGERAVRVMTVHQSKGLGFDVVILPDLMGRSLDKAHNLEFLVARDSETQQPEWILKAPRRLVGEAEAVLRDHYLREDADCCFDALCVLYVALTRAKRGLYLVTSFAGKSAKALTEAALLKEVLAPECGASEGALVEIDGVPARRFFETGDAGWYEQVTDTSAAPAVKREAPLADDYGRRASLRSRLKTVEPSAEEEAAFPAARLFSAQSRDVVEFGKAIHSLLEQVDWIDEVDVEGVIAEWERGTAVSPEVTRDVVVQFRQVLATADVQALLARPQGAVRLWREKSFELVTDEGLWMTGVFDRVVIHDDASGKPESACIIDYKSSLVENDQQIVRKIDVYRPQLASYRTALSRILNLPEADIACRILFTRAGAVRELF